METQNPKIFATAGALMDLMRSYDDSWLESGEHEVYTLVQGFTEKDLDKNTMDYSYTGEILLRIRAHPEWKIYFLDAYDLYRRGAIPSEIMILYYRSEQVSPDNSIFLVSSVGDYLVLLPKVDENDIYTPRTLARKFDLKTR